MFMSSLKTRPRWFTLICGLSLLVVLWLPIANVAAHGGGALQIANAPVGTCLASVWLAPATPRANKTLHVTVGLADSASSTPVLDGAVQVVITSAENGRQVAAGPATTAQSVNRLFYEADLPAQPPGDYRFMVTSTCQGVTETLTFVTAVRPSTNPLFIGLPLAIGGLLAAAWLWRQWRREPGPKPVHRRRDA